MKFGRTHSRAMRRAVSVLGLVMAFAAGALWRGAQQEPGHTDDAPEAARNGEPMGRMYYCSMHPQVRSPDPDDKCPICFMDLIPVPEDDEAEDGDPALPRLRLSDQAVALMEIQTWPAERRAVEIEVPLFGQIDVDATRIYSVAARADGYIERLFVNTPWQPVARGEALAEVFSPAVITAMREWLVSAPDAAQVTDSKEESAARIRREAARERLLRMGVSERQIDELAQKGKAPRTFRLESPVSGAILEITAREGDFLREGDPVTRLADLSRVWVNLEAYERDLPWLSTGLPASFTVAALPGRKFEGKVAFIEPAVHPRSRTVRLRVEVDNPEERLNPGMYVSAVIRAPSLPEPAPRESGPESETPHLPLVVPASAPLITGRRSLVYVRIPDTERPTFEPRRVTLGSRADDFYIVKEGLEEGELVVVHGAFKIDSELQIRGRPGMMTPQEVEVGDRPAKHEGKLQTHCPVMGWPINKDIFVDVKGYRIYVCCPGCIDEVRARADEIITDHRSRGLVFERVGDEP